MIVCSCNVISDREIEDVILEMLRADPWKLIVPGRVHHAMKKRGKCCGCYPSLIDLIIRVTDEFHAHLGTCVTVRGAFIDRLTRELNGIEETRRRIRMRTQTARAA